MNRRVFLETVVAAAAVPALAGQAAADVWGTPVFDLHFHLRPEPTSNLAHLDGVGVRKANLLTRGDVLDRVKALQAVAPGRFTWFNSYDVTKPDAEQALTRAAKDGAQGFGEMKFHVAADGPELRRIYVLAADLHVPILVRMPTRSGPTSARTITTKRPIRLARSSVAVSPTDGWATIPISSETSRPIPATTPSHAIRGSPPIS